MSVKIIKGRKGALLALVGSLCLAQPLWAADYDQHWAKVAIDKWKASGVVQGMDNGDFKPNDPVRRAELATFINRTFQYTPSQVPRKYTDVQAGIWYSEAIANVTGRQIMYTPGASFDPNQPATREEVAYALAKAYHVKADSHQPMQFTDAQTISPWAVESVQALVQKGYINGRPDGRFKPQDPITRAEVVTLLEHLTPNLIDQPGIYTEVIPGNVVIQTGGVVLRDVTIEGDVYLCGSMGEGQVVLDNVKVIGTVYVQGGTSTLSGDYHVVQVDTPGTVDFIQGRMKQMRVSAEGAPITLHKDTSIENLLLAVERPMTIAGIVEETSKAHKGQVYIEKAGVFIQGQFVPVEVEGTDVIIDLRALAQTYTNGDKMEHLALYTNVEGAYIEGLLGSKMRTNVPYTFRQADAQLGIFDQMLDQVTSKSEHLTTLAQTLGVTADTLYALLSEDGQISISHMLMQYENVKSLVQSYTNETLPGEYTFTRYLGYEGVEPSLVRIRLVVE